MSIMSKLARIAKPGMAGAVLVGIAVTAAAAYTQKLALQYAEHLEEIERAQDELSGLAMQRASIIVEMESFAATHNQALQAFRETALADLTARFAQDIKEGKFDDAVTVRAQELARVTDDVNAE